MYLGQGNKPPIERQEYWRGIDDMAAWWIADDAEDARHTGGSLSSPPVMSHSMAGGLVFGSISTLGDT